MEAKGEVFPVNLHQAIEFKRSEEDEEIAVCGGEAGLALRVDQDAAADGSIVGIHGNVGLVGFT
jgi:hypothetical protein